LQDHRDLAAAHALHLALALGQEIDAVEPDLAAHDPRGRPRREPDEAETRHALARPRLADEPQRLALAHAERHAVHRADRPPPRHQVGLKVANLDDRRHSWRSFGSSVSRSQSPIRLKASTTSRIARPGRDETHHALVTN